MRKAKVSAEIISAYQKTGRPDSIFGVAHDGVVAVRALTGGEWAPLALAVQRPHRRHQSVAVRALTGGEWAPLALAVQ